MSDGGHHYFSFNAGSKYSDQNGWLSWLICVSAGANVTCLVFLRLGSLLILLYVHFVAYVVIEGLVEDWQCQMSHPL